MLSCRKQQDFLKKGPPKSRLSTFAKRRKITRNSPSPEPKTPDQMTTLANPNYSNASNESKDEQSTRELLYSFLANTIFVLGAACRTLSWAEADDCELSFKETYTPLFPIVMTEQASGLYQVSVGC